MAANNNTAEIDASFKPPPAFKISRQLDQEKIEFLSKRVEVKCSATLVLDIISNIAIGIAPKQWGSTFELF